MPTALPATGADIVMVSGVLDRLVPPYVAHDYARSVRSEIAVELVNIEDAGHFDLVATGPAWDEARRSIEAALLEPVSHIAACLGCLRDLWSNSGAWKYRERTTGLWLRQLFRERYSDYA